MAFTIRLNESSAAHNLSVSSEYLDARLKQRAKLKISLLILYIYLSLLSSSTLALCSIFPRTAFELAMLILDLLFSFVTYEFVIHLLSCHSLVCPILLFCINFWGCWVVQIAGTGMLAGGNSFFLGKWVRARYKGSKWIEGRGLY